MTRHLTSLGFCIVLAAAAVSRADSTDTCLLEALRTADDATTVGTLRARCAEPAVAALNPLEVETVAAAAPAGVDEGASFREQLTAEQQSLDRSYSLTPHWPNFLLAYSHYDASDPLVAEPLSNGSLEDDEAVLQVSVKFPVWREIFGSPNDLMFAYTSKSWFQAYNNEASKPFRETNYEPEVFWRHYGGPRILGIDIAGWDLGYLHQSNGRSEPLSRSWDRVNGRLALVLSPSLSMIVRAWYRIPEDASDDDNPDIHRYLGYGDLRAIWAPNRNTFTAMYRPGTEESGMELTWSYPINDHFRIYAEYYNGYGESLIDYDRKVERIGIGFTINDYVQSH